MSTIVDTLEPYYAEYALGPGPYSGTLEPHENQPDWYATPWAEYGRVSIPTRLVTVVTWGLGPPVVDPDAEFTARLHIGWLPIVDGDIAALVVGQTSGSEMSLDPIQSEDGPLANYDGPFNLLPAVRCELTLRWRLVVAPSLDDISGMATSTTIIAAGVAIMSGQAV